MGVLGLDDVNENEVQMMIYEHPLYKQHITTILPGTVMPE
jgi:hypothetical protein